MVIEIKEDSLKVKAGRNTALSFYIFVFALLIPFIILNSSKALQTTANLNVFIFYSATIALALIYLLISDFTQSLRKGSWTSIFNSYGHNPSDGWFNILLGKDEPKTLKTISKSIFVMFWVSVIVSLLISFVYVITPTGSQVYQAPSTKLNEIPVSSQLGQIYLAMGGGYTEELVFLSGMLGILFGFSLYLAKGNKIAFMVYEIIGMVITLASILIYHYARYGTNDSALIGVGAIFLIEMLIVKVTGSIVFGLIFHPMLNQVWKASQLFQTNETILLWMIGTVAFTMVISTIIYIVRQWSMNKTIMGANTI